jgi:hypothetical protein
LNKWPVLGAFEPILSGIYSLIHFFSKKSLTFPDEFGGEGNSNRQIIVCRHFSEKLFCAWYEAEASDFTGEPL